MNNPKLSYKIICSNIYTISVDGVYFVISFGINKTFLITTLKSEDRFKKIKKGNLNEITDNYQEKLLEYVLKKDSDKIKEFLYKIYEKSFIKKDEPIIMD